MKVKFFATYRPITGCSMVEAPEQPDVLSLLEWLMLEFPGLKGELLDDSGTEIAWDCIVMVNGRHVEHMDGVATPLSSDDTVAVFPLVAGG